jgi:hypothetical protein
MEETMLDKSSSLAAVPAKPPFARRRRRPRKSTAQGGDYRRLPIYRLIAPGLIPPQIAAQLTAWPPAPTARVSNGGLDVAAAIAAQTKLFHYQAAMARPVAQRPKSHVEAVPIWIWSPHLRCWLHGAVSPRQAELLDRLQTFGGDDTLARAGFAHTSRVAELRQLGCVISSSLADRDRNIWVYDIHSTVTREKPKDGKPVLLIGDVAWAICERYRRQKLLEIDRRADRQKNRLFDRLRIGQAAPPWRPADSNITAINQGGLR